MVAVMDWGQFLGQESRLGGRNGEGQESADLSARQDPESPNGHFYGRNVDLALKTLPNL